MRVVPACRMLGWGRATAPHQRAAASQSARMLPSASAGSILGGATVMAVDVSDGARSVRLVTPPDRPRRSVQAGRERRGGRTLVSAGRTKDARRCSSAGKRVGGPEPGWQRTGEVSSAGRPDLCPGTDDASSGGTPGRLRIAAATIARHGATAERAGTGAFTRAEWPATVAIPYQPVPSLRIAAADVPGASGCAPTRTGRIAATAAGAAASPVSTEQPIQARSRETWLSIDEQCTDASEGGSDASEPGAARNGNHGRPPTA